MELLARTVNCIIGHTWLKAANEVPALSVEVLTLVMHKLSTTRSKIGSDLLPSGIYLDLLKALPPLASNKCCVGLVLQIIQSLNKPGLQVIKLQLLYDLWAVENRCYPYLQRCLEQVEFDEVFYFFFTSGFYCNFRILIVFFRFQKTTSAGFRLAKAQTVLRVVTAQPEKHGGDLLKITSGLLTEALAGMTIDH